MPFSGMLDSEFPEHVAGLRSLTAPVEDDDNGGEVLEDVLVAVVECVRVRWSAGVLVAGGASGANGNGIARSVPVVGRKGALVSAFFVIYHAYGLFEFDLLILFVFVIDWLLMDPFVG